MSSTGYEALVGPGATPEGPDQGFDFTSSSPFAVRALGPGIITRLVPQDSGWPGQGGPTSGGLITERITAGPLAGRNIYVAENIVPESGLAVGSQVNTGQVIAVDRGPYPGLEAGFADAAGSPIAPLLPKGTDYAAAGYPQGAEFGQTVQALSKGAIPSPSSPGPFGSPDFGATGGSAAGGGGLGALAGTPTPAATANTSSSKGGIVGSLREAGIRVLEVGVGILLVFLALRQLATVFRV